ncbi:MYXO-CTERM sorting domain-containing protein [Nannocystaceae bacterium ST9]
MPDLASRSPKRTFPIILAFALGAGLPDLARADEFAAGSLIIPMDTDFQDLGMLRAFGLVYALLDQGVPVRWVIRADKLHGEADFTTSATNLADGEPIPMHDYRGGPFVIDAADADEALPIVEAWQQANPQVAVHAASGAFEADVARYLIVAPTIAMIADGNQKIARKYMAAAAIPDSTGNLLWPDASPDMLDVDELAGPSTDDHRDGLLFDDEGDPVYCQLMSMHWAVADAQDNPEVVAEVRQYLNNPVHFFAECQAVNAFENLDPHGFFLTPHGFEIGESPNAVEYFNPSSPYVQIDGAFEAVGGSEPSYSLPPGDEYLAGGITMITAAGTPIGVEDVWMTGFLDGACPPTEAECGSYGKISYLGGHEYATALPISANPDSQGARLFLNSLFEAPCATLDGLPSLNLAAGAPAFTAVPMIEIDVAFANTSAATALDATLRSPLPAGTSLMSASDGGVEMAGELVWTLGNLGPDESGARSFVIALGEFGVYPNTAALDYRVGLNEFTLPANVVETLYADEPPADTGSESTDSATGADSADSATGADSNDTGDSGSGSGGDTGGTSLGESGNDEVGESGGSTSGTDDEAGCACAGAPPRTPPLAWLLALGLGLGLRSRRSR